MAKAKAKKREAEELVAPDPFLEVANKAASWVEKHGRTLVLGTLAVVAAVAATLIVGAQQERGASERTQELSDAVAAYQDGLQLASTGTTAETVKAKFSEAEPKFQSLIQTYGTGGVGQLSRLYAADIARRLEKHAEAEKYFSEFASAAAKDDKLLFVALEGAGYAAEAQDKHDVALQHFTALTNLPGGFYKDYGYKHQGRIYEAKGETDAAAKAYKAILDEVTDSKLRDFAEQRLKALGVEVPAPVVEAAPSLPIE